MQEELISFETAKVAKERGFTIYETIDEFGYYHCYSLLENYSTFNQGYLDMTGRDAIYYPCSTQGFLQRWLREIHKISVVIKHYSSGTFSYQIQIHNKDSTGWTKVTALLEKSFFTYEDALEKGLVEGLNLIKKKE